MSRIWRIALVVVFLWSCVKEIDVEVVELPQKPVVNCLFSPGTPFSLHVSLSVSPFDRTLPNVGNATVLITGSDGSSVMLSHTDGGIYTNNNYKPVAGVKYNLTVKVPEFEVVTATGTIPHRTVNIKQIVTTPGIITQPVEGTGDKPQYPVQNIKLILEHEPGEAEFMGVSARHFQVNFVSISDWEEVLKNEDSTKYVVAWHGSDDPVILAEGLEQFYAHELLIFKDVSFKQPLDSVHFYIRKYTPSRFWMRFYQYSPDAFQYIKSWYIHDGTKYTDIWESYEPYPQFSNIENGYGIFAGFNRSDFALKTNSVINY